MNPLNIMEQSFQEEQIKNTPASSEFKESLLEEEIQDELTVHDDWKVMGLQGTGSCSYSTSNLFVPSSFTWSMTNDEPIRGGAINYLGRPGFVTMDHAAFALGVAKKALETIIEISKTKIRGYNTDRKNVSERDSFKRDLGLAQTKLAAARALV